MTYITFVESSKIRVRNFKICIVHEKHYFTAMPGGSGGSEGSGGSGVRGSGLVSGLVMSGRSGVRGVRVS